MVLSVGVVWWATRAAGLVSSLLASSLAWRHVDPLPVLGRDDEESAVGWGDPTGEEATKEETSASEMFDDTAKKQRSA
jgi:hypothetical protein